MPDQLTLAEKRARLEELCEDLRRLATMPPLQRIGNVGMRIVIGEQWILDLALEALARRERGKGKLYINNGGQLVYRDEIFTPVTEAEGE